MESHTEIQENKQLYDKKIKHVTKRPKNIRDWLVRAKLNYHPERENERIKCDNKCEHKNCSICPKLNKSGTMKSHKYNKKHGTKPRYDVKAQMAYIVSNANAVAKTMWAKPNAHYKKGLENTCAPVSNKWRLQEVVLRT